jgi:hypothetical protein
MFKPKLTILTDPMTVGQDIFPETARRLARRLKYAVLKRNYTSHPRFRGHFAVTRSLVEGLEKIGADFNYNPTTLSQCADTVIVLAGVRTLRQAIRLKQEGKLRKLFAGPNVVHFSSDFGSILASPDVDAAITPCDWVIENYVADNPSLLGRIFAWPAGVDTAFWKPDAGIKRDRILILDKRSATDDPKRIIPFVGYLQEQGWIVDVLERQRGKVGYTQERYLQLLQHTCLMVGFTGGSESQGIAWTEAWAADVPTLLWRNTQQVLHGRLLRVSTAPYLCEQNGLFFDDLEQFKQQFAYWQAHRAQFPPRGWVLENMSDEVCARQLYDKVMSC